VSVNGKTIPFNMKIGEAGEAFFVFETDAEVPDELITSPILEATRPGAKNTVEEVQAGRFGARETPDDEPSSQEPDYFDLDAGAPSANTPEGKEEEITTPTETRQLRSDDYTALAADSLHVVADAVRPSNIVNSSVGLGKAMVHAVIETEREKREHLQDRLAAARNMAQHLRHDQSSGATEIQGDEALPDLDVEAAQPNPIEYHEGKLTDLSFEHRIVTKRHLSDVVIDLAGYHERHASERTITPEAREVENIDSNPSPGTFISLQAHDRGLTVLI
jgi:phosphatidate phosphatase LPIN